MNKLQTADLFADVWRTSRNDSGKTQEYVAQALGVSRKTVQNWEAGYTSPSIIDALLWFQVLEIPAMPYFLRLLYPEQFDGKDVTQALKKCVETLPPRSQAELLYVLTGAHGSETLGVLEMLTAHLHVPLKDRLNVAHNILINYEIAEAQETLLNADQAPPNIEFLKTSYDNATDAVKKRQNSYKNY